MFEYGSPTSFSFWATRESGRTSRQTSPVPGVGIDCFIKILRRKAVTGLLYTLLGLSLISTYTFWYSMRHGTSMVRSRVDTQVADADGNNFSNLTPSTAEQHPLQWQDVVGHLNVKELFAIRPSNQKETVEKSSARKSGSPPKTSNVASTNTENARPFITENTPPPVVCPELVIPGLIEVKALDLKDLSMNQSERYVLGDQIKQSKDFIKEGNRQLYERYNLTQVRKPIMDSMSQLAVKVGNYSWFPGGHWKPTSCLPRWKVAIIIPFRNRSYHLPIVLKYLTPMLRRQLLEFAFYVIEQNNVVAFNRAMLMNVGFFESLNFSKWDCFIFHDVDHIPLSDFNYYGCSGMPRHFLTGSDRWKYKLPYYSFFGAVTGLTTGNIRKINGFPNVYWGWGGEDDEIWERVKEAKLAVSRPQGPTGFYNVISHHHNSAPMMKERMKLLKNFRQRHKTDGLNNLRYKKPHIEFHPLYTNIAVDIQKLPYGKVYQPAPPAQQPAPHAKQQAQPGDKLKDAKKAVEFGNNNKAEAQPAIEKKKTRTRRKRNRDSL